MTHNLHISLGAFRSASRILKETATLAGEGGFARITIIALHEGELVEHERLDAQRAVWRVRLRSRGLSRQLPAQMVKYLEFCWRVLRFARSERATLVNVHSLSLLPLGVILKWTTGARLVYDAHELETERNGLYGSRQWLSRIVERSCIGAADLVIVVSDGIRDWYLNRYGRLPIVTVMNCPRWRALAPTDMLRERLGIHVDDCIVLYHGALLRGRGIEALLHAFSTSDVHGLAFVVMGYGELESEVRSAAERVPSIHLHPAVPPAEVLEYVASADAGVAFIEDTCLSYHWCLPNKLFECLMAGLPVAVSDLPEMARVVRADGVGVVVRWPDSGDALVTALRETCALAADPAMIERVRRCAARYTWETQAAVMVGAYRERGLA